MSVGLTTDAAAELRRRRGKAKTEFWGEDEGKATDAKVSVSVVLDMNLFEKLDEAKEAERTSVVTSTHGTIRERGERASAQFKFARTPPAKGSRLWRTSRGGNKGAFAAANV